MEPSAMSDALPPQRRAPGGGAPRGQGRPGPGGPGGGGGRDLTPAQGAAEAERRLGRPCYHAGQKVEGLFGCVACQFQIRNRAIMPACPQCGELVWAFLDEGPRPVPEGETAPVPGTSEAPPTIVQEGVKLDVSQPVRVEENVRLEP